MNKLNLRRHLRITRAGAPTRTVPPRPELLARFIPDLIVATYSPIGSEADPSHITQAARAAGCILALPHVTDRATLLRFLTWDGAPLKPGPFGLHQPDADAPRVTPDIILTPLLGFDRRGNRLGQGAGHYDRAFAAHPGAWRVGVALGAQEVAGLTPDPWDVPLHAVITDTEWINVNDHPQ